MADNIITNRPVKKINNRLRRKSTVIKIIAVFVILLIVCLALTAYIEWYVKRLPSEYFDSLQELKDSIDSSLNIIFPDTTGYELEEDAMYRKDYKGKINVVMGYSYGGDLNADQSHTNLSSIYFRYQILDVAYDDKNPAPNLNANTQILELDVFERIADQSENPDHLASGNFQEGSKIVSYIYQFDLKGYRYSISAHLIILPEELNNLNSNEVDAKVENCKNEVLNLVESIIKQEESEKSSD